VIDKHEIDAKADELGVHAAIVQRDYVFGWLLAGLAQAENRLRSSLILKGGNCFRKAYFEHARFSNDLDFSTQTELCADALVEGLSQACEFAGETHAPLTRVHLRSCVSRHSAFSADRFSDAVSNSTEHHFSRRKQYQTERGQGELHERWDLREQLGPDCAETGELLRATRGATAQCRDGSYSFSRTDEACFRHGLVWRPRGRGSGLGFSGGRATLRSSARYFRFSLR